MTNSSLAAIIQVRLAARGTSIDDQDALDVAEVVGDAIRSTPRADAFGDEPTREISPALLDNLRAACAAGV